MRARTATIGDLGAVLGDLSLRLADNFDASGLGIEKVRDALVMNLREGRAHALANAEEVSALIAWHVSGEIIHTLFVAQESFFTASTVRFCRTHIRYIQTLEGNLPVQHRSWLTRRDAVARQPISVLQLKDVLTIPLLAQIIQDRGNDTIALSWWGREWGFRRRSPSQLKEQV